MILMECGMKSQITLNSDYEKNLFTLLCVIEEPYL